jgi:MraZ protein
VAFRGQHEHSLDSKDRVTIPARFRAALSDGVVLLESLDPCVSVYPIDRYEALSERFLAGQSPFSRKGRMMQRRFHARSRDEALDSAGRVRLARHLIEYAGLEGPCLVVGVDDHLEIWHPGRWAEHDAEIDAQAEGIAEELAAGGPQAS